MVESRTYPGCTQQPRVPFTIAATGKRGLALTARQGQMWVTFGPLAEHGSPQEWYDGVRAQAQHLDAACVAAGRDESTLRRAALVGLELGWAQSSVPAWDEFCGHIEALGFTDVIVHWPRPHDPKIPGPPPDVFDVISSRLT